MVSARMFTEKDADLTPLSGKTIVFIGYGNQGRAQALNIRDTIKAAALPSPPKIVIANPRDAFSARAAEDGFESTTDWAAAAAEADVLFLLVPDPVQPKLFDERLAPTLKKGCAVVIASGYNAFYGKLKVAKENDVVMVAPRMIGTSVRTRFESGEGYPCFVSVEQDGTGKAWKTTLALAYGIGALKGGAIESSAREETLMDLFAEQALYPTIIATFREAYSTLKALGCSDEALCHELWMSKEPAEVFEKAADDGFIRQLVHHSVVSQYGQLKGSMEVDTTWMKKEFKRVSEQRVLGGEFAKEFSALDEDGDGDGIQKKLDSLYAEALKSELGQGEKRVRERLGLKTI
ncbi:MAG: hypothetical protein M4579_006639 [Chaenotheca gracillima]|nr:MAG: hypothetical protein M4579_006639 [Chaenotheca gracillima]